jgi:hypothetical protein
MQGLSKVYERAGKWSEYVETLLHLARMFHEACVLLISFKLTLRL